MHAGWRCPLLLLALFAFATPGCAPKTAPTEPAGTGAYDDAVKAFGSGNYAAAAEGFEQATGQTPDKADAYYFLGLSLQKSLNARAEQAYLKALSLDGSNVLAMEALGILYFSAGDFGKAGMWLEKAASMDGKNAEAALCLGDVYFLSGQCDKALPLYRKAAQLDPQLASAARRVDAAEKSCAKGGAAKSFEQPAAPSAPQPAGKPAPKIIDLNDI